ncbi:MAG TPA: MlaD family protein [Chitinophagales bacterium]|nr:MlaD family protein [Chitinophagales bacterium]
MKDSVKVGIFTVITIAIAVLGYYFLKGIDLFQRKNSYYAVYDRVDGLYKSNLVEINGFPVGRVGDMERDPVTGKIVVRLDLDKDLKLPNSPKTVASLFSTDFLGTKKIQLLLGKSDSYLNGGDTINTYFRKDLTEQIGSQIDPIMAGVNNMVPKLDSTISGINWFVDQRNPRGIYTTKNQVDEALIKLNGILDANQATLQATLKNIESITANIEKQNGTITVMIKNVGSFSDSLQQANLKQTILNLNSSVEQLKTLLGDVNAGHGTLGKVVKDDALYTKVDSTVGSLNTLLKDIKARPYRYINISVFGAKAHEKRMEKNYDESGK